jgi:hypothetical protein
VWRAVAAVGLRFSDVAEAARHGGGTETLGARTHRWALADRVAWGEAQVDLPTTASTVAAELAALLADPPRDRQVVHGDLTGNVYVDRDDVPVVLDFSPYLRPREWGEAIVVADAVLWNGAALVLAQSFAATPERAMSWAGRCSSAWSPSNWRPNPGTEHSSGRTVGCCRRCIAPRHRSPTTSAAAITG